MIRVGYICGNKADATSLYRAVGPFQELQKRMSGVAQFVEIKEVCWSVFGFLDILFMQRPSSISSVQVLKKAYDMGIPIWLDFDDDFLSVPMDNPAHEEYSKPEIKKYLLDCFEYANVVTCSTQTLLDKFYDVAVENKVVNMPQFVLIPNVFNDFLFNKPDKSMSVPQNVIMWRGSPTHLGDLLSVKKDVETVAKKYPDWIWLFLGQVPWILRDVIDQKRILHVPLLDIIGYTEVLKKVHPAISIVPLVDNEFNRAKSNIAWQEATFAGSVTVAPGALPEFKMPGIYNYTDQTGNTFVDVVSTAIETPSISRQMAVKQSWDHIEQNLLLSKINEARKQIVLQLSK